MKVRKHEGEEAVGVELRLLRYVKVYKGLEVRRLCVACDVKD